MPTNPGVQGAQATGSVGPRQTTEGSAGGGEAVLAGPSLLARFLLIPSRSHPGRYGTSLRVGEAQKGPDAVQLDSDVESGTVRTVDDAAVGAGRRSGQGG